MCVCECLRFSLVVLGFVAICLSAQYSPGSNLCVRDCLWFSLVVLGFVVVSLSEVSLILHTTPTVVDVDSTSPTSNMKTE